MYCASSLLFVSAVRVYFFTFTYHVSVCILAVKGQREIVQPHNVASDQGQHRLLTGFSIKKNRIKMTRPDTPKMTN